MLVQHLVIYIHAWNSPSGIALCETPFTSRMQGSGGHIRHLGLNVVIKILNMNPVLFMASNSELNAKRMYHNYCHDPVYVCPVHITFI